MIETLNSIYKVHGNYGRVYRCTCMCGHVCVGMYVWACMCGHVCVGMCVCACMCVHVCVGMCVWACVCVHVCVGMCVWACMCGHVCVGMYVWACMCECVYGCVCVVCVWAYGCYVPMMYEALQTFGHCVCVHYSQVSI